MRNRLLTVERISNPEAQRAYREHWNELLLRNSTHAKERTFERQLTHWKHSWQRSERFVPVVRQDTLRLGVAPLKLTQLGPSGFRLRRLERTGRVAFSGSGDAAQLRTSDAALGRYRHSLKRAASLTRYRIG